MMHMKHVILSLLCITISCRGIAQTTVEIEVVDALQQPLAAKSVVLKEKSRQAAINKRTDANGKVVFNLTDGRIWEVYVDGYHYEEHFITVKPDEISQQQLFITHNPQLNERLKKQRFSRKNFQIQPTASIPAQPEKGFFLAQLTVTNSDGKKLMGKQVTIVQLQQQKMYQAITNVNGIAVFHLPNNQTYDIDVEEHLNAAFLDVGNSSNTILYKTIVYDSYDMVEKIKNDTITQHINLPLVKKNSRACYSVIMHKASGNVQNENVFLNDVESNIVYKAKTDANGEAVFILPFGKKFLIHFNYQRDVDVIDLTTARGKAEGFLEVNYKPDPALEHPETFIPTTANLFLTDFNFYHKLPYPNPNSPNKPGISIQHMHLPKQGIKPTTIVELGLSATFMEGMGRLPLNISFVMDKSGSMAGYERIESLKTGFIQLIEKLQPNDVVAVILFNDEMELLWPAQPIGNNKAKLIALIQSIQPSGGTNMLEAMKKGYEQVMLNLKKNATNMVVLLTDGYDSNDADTLLQLQQPYNGKIACTAIGVGNDYNYALLRQLVDKASGLFNFAGEGKALIDLFGNRLIAFSAPAIKDISIEITHTKNIQCKNVYGAKSLHITPNKTSAKLNDLYRLAEQPVLLEFQALPDAGVSTITVVINYTNTVTGQQESITKQLECKPADAATENQAALRKMYAVAFTNDCLTKMSTAFEKNNIPVATEALTKAAQLLQQLFPVTADADIKELKEKIKRYQTAFRNLAIKRKIEKE